MKFRAALQLSIRFLRLNLLRTTLTVLGVVIGVAAIIVVFAAGDAVRNLVTEEIASYGTDIIDTEIKMPKKRTASSLAQVTTLKVEDMEAVNKLANIKQGYGALLGQQKVSWQGQSERSLLFGVSASYAEIDQKSQPIEGRFFTAEEDKNQAMVAVIGYSLKEELFGNQSPLGEWIKIGNNKFQVIGIMEERGRGGDSKIDIDKSVYMPLKTLQKRILGVDYILYMVHQLKDPSKAEDTAAEVTLLLRERHGIDDPDKDDFRVITMTDMMDTLNTVTNTVTWLLLAIVAISLIVGGIGIMNIMYVTVSERTPEIGLRKALGANYHDIVEQFLMEAMLITIWGFIIGTIVGLLLAWILSIVASHFGIEWSFIFPWLGIGTALIFSVICGLLFGLRPAQKAAKLDPVEALRTD